MNTELKNAIERLERAIRKGSRPEDADVEFLIDAIESFQEAYDRIPSPEDQLLTVISHFDRGYRKGIEDAAKMLEKENEGCVGPESCGCEFLVRGLLDGGK